MTANRTWGKEFWSNLLHAASKQAFLRDFLLSQMTWLNYTYIPSPNIRKQLV